MKLSEEKLGEILARAKKLRIEENTSFYLQGDRDITLFIDKIDFKGKQQFCISVKFLFEGEYDYDYDYCIEEDLATRIQDLVNRPTKEESRATREKVKKALKSIGVEVKEC